VVALGAMLMISLFRFKKGPRWWCSNYGTDDVELSPKNGPTNVRGRAEARECAEREEGKA